MKIQMAFVGWFVLLGHFLPSASWADNHNVFPIKPLLLPELSWSTDQEQDHIFTVEARAPVR